MTRRAV